MIARKRAYEPAEDSDGYRVLIDRLWSRGVSHHATGLPLTVDIAEDLPTVETDSGRVRQIVGNLLSNAIKYTKTGAVTLRVRVQPAIALRKVQSSVGIEVIDIGLGIPEDKREQILEKFRKVQSTGHE